MAWQYQGVSLSRRQAFAQGNDLAPIPQAAQALERDRFGETTLAADLTPPSG
jgi:hypothetical protein